MKHNRSRPEISITLPLVWVRDTLHGLVGDLTVRIAALLSVSLPGSAWVSRYLQRVPGESETEGSPKLDKGRGH